MSAAAVLALPVADHPLVTALPFFVPVVLIVGGILALRAVERMRDPSRRR